MYGLFIVLGVVGVVWVLREAGRTSPAKQRRFVRQVTGFALCALSLVFALKGFLIVAVPMFGVGAGILGLQQLNFAKRTPPQPTTTSMNKAEALAVLGLSASASADEIRAAHKKLLRAIHPDAGGSTYLSAKINAARDLLLKS
ncbi:MAG: hypothetical protein ABI230_12100 [Aestuariivirga sp.]